MQDDCYLIADEGWTEAAKPKLIIDDKNKKLKEKPDFIVGRKKYKTELIPSALVINRYFAKEQEDIEKMETKIAALQQQIEELAEGHGGEGGLLEDAKNEKDKITKASIAARLKEIKGDTDADDERKVLQEYLALSENESDANIALRTAQDRLMEEVADKYSELDEDEIKTLVVDDKWLATLAAAVQGELDRVSQTLTGRIRELSERYASPLPKLTDEVEKLSARVNEHLKKMGFSIN
jgi:type I restriction enzyme M protein